MEIFCFRSRRCICSDSFSFCSLAPLPDFFYLVFSSTAPGEKTTDITANNREMARVQGGMDWEPVIRVFFSLFDFHWRKDRYGVLGFGRNWDLIWGNMGRERKGLATWTVANRRQISFLFLALDMDRFHFLVFLFMILFPHNPPSPRLMAKRILGRFFTESACRLTVSIEVIVHDTRAPNKEDLPSIIFNLPMILHLLRTFLPPLSTLAHIPCLRFLYALCISWRGPFFIFYF